MASGIAKGVVTALRSFWSRVIASWRSSGAELLVRGFEPDDDPKPARCRG